MQRDFWKFSLLLGDLLRKMYFFFQGFLFSAKKTIFCNFCPFKLKFATNDLCVILKKTLCRIFETFDLEPISGGPKITKIANNWTLDPQKSAKKSKLSNIILNVFEESHKDHLYQI